MELTNSAPNVPISQFKRTKIVATVGPATDSYEQVLALIKAGANGLRLNFSHGDHQEHGRRIKWIRKASKACGKPVAIIQDLQGPKIRLGDFDGMVTISTGQSFRFQYNANYETSGIIPIQYDLSTKMKRGERLTLFDGRVHMTITSIKEGVIYATAENDGFLVKRKGINIPDTDLGGDVITKKDKEDLAFGSTQDIDYVAQSFVQTADDIRALRKLMRGLNMDAQVIVKFETRSAVEHMDEIMRETDMVMVARGDLAYETMPESVPIVQRQLIGLGRRYAKPSIVATQMLATMTESPEPTRAEVSDVATAAILGADCVMLSEETAAGKYPIQAVKIMKRIVNYTQTNNPAHVTYPAYEESENTKSASISRAVVNLADQMHAQAIVVETLTGATAAHIAALRSSHPIIVVTSKPRTAHQLAMVYGVKSYIRPVHKLAVTKLTEWLREAKVLKVGDIIVTASGQYPGVVGTTDTIKVRILE